jgi:hypothetical protein
LKSDRHKYCWVSETDSTGEEGKPRSWKKKNKEVRYGLGSNWWFVEYRTSCEDQSGREEGVDFCEEKDLVEGEDKGRRVALDAVIACSSEILLVR